MKTHLLPQSIKNYQQITGLNYNKLLSVNPKTIKNKLPTSILHLSPANSSGLNVCKYAGNCKAICLNYAGNPAFKSNKLQARLNRTLSFSKDNHSFMLLLLLNICRNIYKNSGQSIALRLNGTSDILYEKISIKVDNSISNFIFNKFQLFINSGEYDNIFLLIKENNLPAICYDYTKNLIDRDITYLKKLGYYLTFSFDGFNNKNNIEQCKIALDNNINIAAAFKVTKYKQLPKTIHVKVLNKTFNIFDGDVSDERYLDPLNVLIGLRFKLPRLHYYSQSDVDKFCIA